MVERDVVLAKVAHIDECLRRITEVREPGRNLLARDVDDLLELNLQRAVQAAIDLAAHVVSTEGYGMPGTLSETFTLLERQGLVAADLAERLRRMTGFRNVAVHEYAMWIGRSSTPSWSTAWAISGTSAASSWSASRSHRAEMSGDLLSVGLVGGMSAESTQVYYRRFIERSRDRLGGVRSPRMVIASVDFAPYAEQQHAGRWDLVAAGIGSELDALAAAGCAFAGIATNTMHKVLPDLAPPLPVLSILDAIADGARARGLRRLGLTGTAFTMEDGFYARGLEERGFAVLVPPAADRAFVHRTIFEELVRGVVEPASVARFAAVGRDLLGAGADAVLLGCTELPMLAAHPDWPPGLPLLDSTEEHVLGLFRAATGLDLAAAPAAAAVRRAALGRRREGEASSVGTSPTCRSRPFAGPPHADRPRGCPRQESGRGEQTGRLAQRVGSGSGGWSKPSCGFSRTSSA